MYKTGINRNDTFIISLNELVDDNSYARVVDAFVDSLNLKDLGFKYSTCKSSGNRPYDPSDMLKLYLLGYRYKIRSSRKLEREAKTNIEFIWLLKNVKPNFRTISDFRKDNYLILKNVFYEFNLDVQNIGFSSSLLSQDGCKVKAVNSKDNNFTHSKLDDRKSHATNEALDYLNLLDTNDEKDDFYELSLIDKLDSISSDIDSFNFKDPNIDKVDFINKINNIHDKLSKYEMIENKMINENTSQVSLTDPESRLMKDNDKFTVGYNNQVLVDDNHFVKNFKLSNNPADLGSITDISIQTKNIYGNSILTNITDKGYIKRDDMMNALENGIIPEVTPTRGNDGFTLETVYEQNDITDDMIKSSIPTDLKKCLRAGVIPDVYRNIITNIEIKDITTSESIYSNNNQNLSQDELRDLAINNNLFTRHLDSNKVFCPMGEILRPKSSTDKKTRYYNKLACKNCKNPCCKTKEKTVDFKPNQTIYVPNGSKAKTLKEKYSKNKTTVKKVIITTKSRKDLLDKRMGMSEHPHAQLKFWDDARYLLLKGMDKATGELALYYCAYNIRRLINIKNNNEIIEYFKSKKEAKLAPYTSCFAFSYFDLFNIKYILAYL